MMFTRRCSQRFSAVFVIFLVSITVSQASQLITKSCAGFNEYCLNHWDCCSKSCMSYLYRCTRPPTIYPYEFLGAPASYNEILELNFGSNQFTKQRPLPLGFNGRFGEPEEDSTIALDTTTIITTTEITSTTTDAAQPEKVKEISPTTTDTPQPEAVTIPLKSGKRQLVLDLQEAGNVAVETTTGRIDDRIVPNNTTVGACKEIGSKCYSPDECCTKRCHGFLHQCVT